MKISSEGWGKGSVTIITGWYGGGTGAGTPKSLARDTGWGKDGETIDGATGTAGGGTKLLVARIPPPGRGGFWNSISMSG